MLPPEARDNGIDDPINAVTIIAEAFRQKFGEFALAAAEKQRDVASDETVIRWDEVVARLKV